VGRYDHIHHGAAASVHSPFVTLSGDTTTFTATHTLLLATAVESNEAVTIRYDSGYLTCSKKLTGSQLSLPHGINKKLECETENKMMSIIGPVQSRYCEAVQQVKRNLRWEGFVEKVGFEPGVKERRSDG